jgi:site-specific DNA-methyltransferase (adenine-specific)|nr:MAG TPA: adenine-specific methyltransferase [Caudoviricetes sp.]
MIENEKYQLYNGDCLEVMDKLIAKGIVVDVIITDPPYGTTACKWDVIIPLNEMWTRLNKLIKPNGAIVLFGTEPFSSKLRTSNIKNYKYDWIWEKEQGVGFQLVRYRPLMKNENISVFCNKTPVYNPQMSKLAKSEKMNRKAGSNSKSETSPLKYSDERVSEYMYRYPVNILQYKRDRGLHPTQKPVALLEYLIKTYTNEGDLVLDFTMGSGSTGVACLNTNRKFIGIELDKKYFNIAEERLKYPKLYDAQLNTKTDISKKQKKLF